MNEKEIEKLLKKVQKGSLSVVDAVQNLKTLPFEDLGFAHIDHHRALRKGFPEVIFGEGKTAGHIIEIMKKMAANKSHVLATRIDEKKAKLIKKAFPKAVYHTASRALTLASGPIEQRGRGTILVVSAGTSDIPVAEEAIVTARIMGNTVDHVYDVGVAGIHRLMNEKEKLMSAHVIVVVAGMEGALPSVVGGLVSRPVIAVPTSTGYGASFGGVAALLGMLNSCASGLAVVNIDNGFGAGYMASLINQT
ncbi:MAG: nickel pincer cofactor biosynthesis protein LarB [Proteobacteria bacterium]|nr:nickel pincer cofactor biosynthesis protein LarB [Pseudomonadota bacterium]